LIARVIFDAAAVRCCAHTSTMRVSALDIRDSGVVAVWWAGAGEHRAVLGLLSGQRVELVDRLLECVPGAAAHEESLQVALGDVAEAGRSVAVHATGFEHSFGLVRPFALGDIDGEELTLAAVVRAVGVSLPVLSADVDAARALAAMVNARAAGAQPWQCFALERGTREVTPASRRGGARAPQTALEGAVIESIALERSERARMISLATGKNRVHLSH
jgi:hypothetical protein